MLIAPLSFIDQRFSYPFLLFVKIYGFFVKSILKWMFSTVYLKQGNISALREKIKQVGEKTPWGYKPEVLQSTHWKTNWRIFPGEQSRCEFAPQC